MCPTDLSRKNILPWLAAILLMTTPFFVGTGCKTGTEANATADSLETPPIESASLEGADVAADDYEGYEQGGSDAPREIIKYEGALEDQKEKDLKIFQQLQDVLSIAQKALGVRDSLFYARGSDQAEGPLDDSIRAAPVYQNAWRALEAYRELMEPGYTFDSGIPGLLDLTRVPSREDSSENYLPEAGKSTLLSKGDFFFLGGAPFIDPVQSDEGAAFESPDGKLEMRFEATISENLNYLFNYVLHMRTQPMKITFGPPLRMYDGWDRDINGAGAIIHTFANRIPVIFLTTKGAVDAELISVRVKLDNEGLGCVSDQPLATFACRENVGAQDIVGVLVQNENQQKISFKYNDRSSALWTADLNDDGIDDLACVASSFEGIAGDGMAEQLWFVNVNGKWKVIDYAVMLDCT